MNAGLVNIRIHAEDLTVLKELFGTDSPKPATSAALDGVPNAKVEFVQLARRPGMTGEDIVITVVINLVTGIPAGVLANWIYTRLSRRGMLPVEVGRDEIVKTTEAEIRKSLGDS